MESSPLAKFSQTNFSLASSTISKPCVCKTKKNSMSGRSALVSIRRRKLLYRSDCKWRIRSSRVLQSDSRRSVFGAWQPRNSSQRRQPRSARVGPISEQYALQSSSTFVGAATMLTLAMAIKVSLENSISFGLLQVKVSAKSQSRGTSRPYAISLHGKCHVAALAGDTISDKVRCS